MPAFAFAFRGSGESPRELAHKLDTAHLCICGNDSGHSASSRNEARDISDPCIRQCVSIGASYRHSEELLDNDHPRADIWLHDEAEANVVAGGVKLADGPTLATLDVMSRCYQHPTLAQELARWLRKLEPGAADIELELFPAQLRCSPVRPAAATVMSTLLD